MAPQIGGRIQQPQHLARVENTLNCSAQGLFAANTIGNGPPAISVNDVVLFVRSPFGLWCRFYAPPEQKAELTRFQEMIFQAGQEHESETIDQRFRDVSVAPYMTLEDGFRKTLEMMELGEPEIVGMPLLSSSLGLRGIPDILVRKEGKSFFGTYRYHVVEVKLARTLKWEHKIQAALYTLMLGAIQGTTPSVFHLVDGEDSMNNFDFLEFEGELDELIAATRAVVTGTTTPEPCYGSTPWPWSEYGDKVALENGDVSLIPGVGPTLQAELHDGGFRTVADIASAEPRKLMNVHGIGSINVQNLIPKAEAIAACTPVKRGRRVRFRQVDVEVFLDFEGDEIDLKPLTYLIGAIVRDRGTAEYKAFLASSPDDEERRFREFCQLVDSMGKVVLYHWHSYEKRHLERLMETYRTPSKLRHRIMSSLVDLQPLTTKAFAFPSYSDSLKSIARSIGFEWRLPDINALLTIAMYRQFVSTGDASLTEAILSYNEDDCRATMHIKDWLADNSR